MYESLTLVDPDTTISTEQVAEELRRFYAEDSRAPSEIAVHGQTIYLRWADYVLEVNRESLPHVLEESAEIAGQHGAARTDRERIAQCTCRFSTHGDDDADMIYFKDYLFVGEAIARLGTVYHFDPSSCEFLE